MHIMAVVQEQPVEGFMLCTWTTIPLRHMLFFPQYNEQLLNSVERVSKTQTCACGTVNLLPASKLTSLHPIHYNRVSSCCSVCNSCLTLWNVIEMLF